MAYILHHLVQYQGIDIGKVYVCIILWQFITCIDLVNHFIKDVELTL
jgi:hypothetical protein